MTLTAEKLILFVSLTNTVNIFSTRNHIHTHTHTTVYVCVRWTAVRVSVSTEVRCIILTPRKSAPYD